MIKQKNILILIICLQISIPFIVENSLRFPVLILHFLHHNNNHEKISFTHFVAEHYSEKQHGENHDQHENLPFHKHFDCSYNHNLALHIETIYINFCKLYNFKEPKKIAFKQNCFQSNVTINIWKPPKIS